MSIGLVMNLIFVTLGLYIFYRSVGMLHDLFTASSEEFVLKRWLRSSVALLGLGLWFLSGTMMTITGLTGLFNKLILAMQ